MIEGRNGGKEYCGRERERERVGGYQSIALASMKTYKVSPQVQMVLFLMAAYDQVPMLQWLKHASGRVMISGGSPVRSGLDTSSRKQPRYVGCSPD